MGFFLPSFRRARTTVPGPVGLAWLALLCDALRCFALPSTNLSLSYVLERIKRGGYMSREGHVLRPPSLPLSPDLPPPPPLTVFVHTSSENKSPPTQSLTHSLTPTPSHPHQVPMNTQKPRPRPRTRRRIYPLLPLCPTDEEKGKSAASR